MSSAGVVVTEEGSLRYAAVFACVRVIAESVASLPLVTFERTGERGKERARQHPLYRLLHDAPNPLMTSLEFREALQGHLLLWGNAYCEIEMDGGGQVTALWPLRPDQMVKIDRAGDGLVYTYQLPEGKFVTLPGWKVLHLRGLSSNGIIGYSPIQWAARDAIGKGIAVQRYGSAFFKNGARPGGLLVMPGELSPEAAARLREAWHENYGGLNNAHRVAVLEQGMTYQEVGINPQDAQYIEDQKMSALDVARVFRVPPHMIGDLDRATFGNIEHQSLEFVMHSLRPWLVRWEMAIQQRLMTAAERERLFVKFNVDGLLRGDTLSRYQAYSIGRQNGFLSANDIREMEDWNPVDGGDEYLVPLNMVPAGSAGGLGSGGADGGQGAVGSEEGDGNVAMNRHTTSTTNDATNYEKRAAGDRVSLIRANRAVFAETMGRICRRQAQDVGAAARKMLNRRDEAGFRTWLEEFFGEHEEWVRRAVLPLYLSYGQTAALAAIREIEGDEKSYDNETFMGAYAATFAAWHIEKTRRKVEGALAHTDDQLGAMEAATGLWASEWPDYLAGKETVQSANAVAKEVYKRNGVSELVWETTWGDKSCAYCESLDGVVVGIEGQFDIPGLPPFRSVAYPPAHDGCECIVVARKS